jgi:hypothetical protein
VVHQALLDELWKIGADLQAQARAQIARGNFALRSHENAAKHEKDEARKEVLRKHPSLAKSAGVIGRIRQIAKNPHTSEVAGLGILAVPGMDHLQAHARARMAGDKTPHGVEKRRLMGDAAHAALDVGGLGVLMGPEFKHFRHK